jgi:hypothetical protein
MNMSSSKLLYDPKQLDTIEADTDEYRKWTIHDIIEREIAAGQILGPFHKRYLLERAPEKVMQHLEMAIRHPKVVAASAQFTGTEGQAAGAPTNFTAVTASATETNLWVPGIWTPIPTNTMIAGKFYRVEFGGVFTTTATQGTQTFTGRMGVSATPSSNASFGASNAVAWAASLTGAAWYGHFTTFCRALGIAASGATFTGTGMCTTQGAAAATATLYVFGSANPTNVDNTAASGLIVSSTISVASQSIQANWVTPVHSLN